MNSSDSNLLFGVIALQLDFIDRDALVDAMQEWTFSRQKTLGELLVEKGKLSEKRLGLLKDLVQEHLRQHGDPQQSLAALEASSGLREAILSIADNDVQASIGHIPATPVDDYATQQVNLPPIGEGGPRFRILRPHAKGGIGQVSVALDKELHREVALKELQMQHAGREETRERFLMEAEITGSLEHPGIVPVYGLGHYADGRPYYAMRFVRGDNMQSAIDAFYKNESNLSRSKRQVEFRTLIQRLIDVCEAIHYAHSRGVLHRDLKPGNIMLGRYGETMVVDWGLAKTNEHDPLETLYDVPPVRLSGGSGTSQTVMGSVIGTPAYMSPEQADGRLDKLGWATDVYGLGATLYHILAGRAPIGKKDENALQRIIRGEIEPPISVNPSVPRALNAVCMKAMHVQQESRYQSSFELAKDLELWLADEPVSVGSEPLSTRIGRWIRRHKTLTSSMAAAVGVGLIALAVTSVMLGAAYRREQASHQRARQMVDRYYTMISESILLNQPGMQALRKDLLQQALGYYQQFTIEHAEDRSLRKELGKAHYRLGLINEASGSLKDAITECQRAEAIQQELADQPQSPPDVFYDLGNSMNALGRMLQRTGKDDASAIDAFNRAAQVRQHLVDTSPKEVKFLRKQANTEMNLALMMHRNGNGTDALEAMKRAQAIRQRALVAKPNDRLLRRDIGKGHYNLANIAIDQKNLDSGRQHYSKAATLFKQLSAEETQDTEVINLLAICYWRLGDLARDLAPEKAVDWYQKANDEISLLAALNPDVHPFQSTLTGVLLAQAATHTLLDQLEQADAIYVDLMPRLEKLAQREPSLIVTLENLIAAKLNRGQNLMLLEQPDAAAELLHDVVASSAADTNSRSQRKTKRAHALAHFQLGRIRWAKSDYPKALSHFATAEQKWMATEKDPLTDPLVRRQLGNLLIERLALLTFLDSLPKSEQPFPDDAERTTTKADLQKRIGQFVPQINQDHEVARRFGTIGRLQWKQNEFKIAIETLTKSVALWEQIIADNDQDTDAIHERQYAKGDLASIYLDYAKSLKPEGKYGLASELLEKSQKTLMSLIKTAPNEPAFQSELEAVTNEIRSLKNLQNANP